MASVSLNFVGMDRLLIHLTAGALIPIQSRLVAKMDLDLVAVVAAVEEMEEVVAVAPVEGIMGEVVAAVAVVVAELALEVIQVISLVVVVGMAAAALVVVGMAAAALVVVLQQRQLPLVAFKRNAGTTLHQTRLTVPAPHDRPSQKLIEKLTGKLVVRAINQMVCVLVRFKPNFRLGPRLMLPGHLPNTFC